MIDARLAQVRRILHVKIALVAEEQGAQKAALPLAVDGLDGLAELLRDALRRIAKRARVTRLIRRLAAAVEQQINALGRKIADVAAVARGIGRAVEKHRVPHALARLKGEQVEAAVVDGSRAGRGPGFAPSPSRRNSSPRRRSKAPAPRPPSRR